MLDKILKYKIEIAFLLFLTLIGSIVFVLSWLSSDFYIGKWRVELNEETKGADIESIEILINQSNIDKFINLDDNVKIHERIVFTTSFKDRLKLYGTIDKFELISIQSPMCRNDKCPKEIQEFSKNYKKYLEETTKQISGKNIEISYVGYNKIILNINSQDIFTLIR